MKKTLYIYTHLLIVATFLLSACVSHPDVPNSSKDAKCLPAIYPDYCNVTIPCNIAPCNFMLSTEEYEECVARFTMPDGSQQTYGNGVKVQIPEDEWRSMLDAAKGKSLKVEVWGKQNGEWLAFNSFEMNVATEPIDPYVSYRLIEPTYIAWDKMEIAQRDLTSFGESQIFNNEITCNDRENGQCINCHSYQNYHTDNMLFHVRVTNGGTVIVNDGNISKVNLKRDNTISAGVYPSWHPTEKLIAFSTNTTRQEFHTAHKNKIEVFDQASDLILYDVEKDEVSIVSADTTRLEVFPTWSPDGKYLYYCSTLSDSTITNIHIDFKKIRYNLYRRSFDCKLRQFGEEELVYDAVSGNHSVSLPRVSPDGRYVIFAQGSYGCFNIWHHDADIVCIPIANQPSTSITLCDLTALNSKDYADSYPSWSSNNKWIMCASRRDDGNYSRIYISYFDGKKAHKAFLLPQRDPEHNIVRIKSYNRPEFMVEPVKISVEEFSKVF